MYIEVFGARDIPARDLRVTEGTLKVVAPVDVNGLVKTCRPRPSSFLNLLPH